MMPQALWRKMEHDGIADGDFAFALDKRHHATLMRRARDDAGATAGMVIVDDLADIASGGVFEIDDQGGT